MRFSPSIATLLLALAIIGAAMPARANDRDGLVLLANSAVPASVELAREYCRLRGLPEDRICALPMPSTEVISRADYASHLRDPLLAWLRANGWADQVKRHPRRVRAHEAEWTTVKSRLRILCSFYGVPVRIEDTQPQLVRKLQGWMDHAPQRDEAAVDSELTLLLQGPYDVRGRFTNPFYGQLRWTPPGAHNLFLVMAARLDGPDPDTVRRMMASALEAEQYGLHGRAYFDLRGPHQDDYLMGDFWLAEAVARFSREGYECVVENSDQLYGRHFPMDEAALYMGWYTDRVSGPFLRTGFVFRAGALAYHNHSGNAKQLRSRDEHWAGPLLASGAAATWGAVSEPFLATTPHLHIVADRLCRGATFAEATYLALPALSWQATVVGDPLYRPFAIPLDEQIRKLEAEGRPEVIWAWLRRINLLVSEGRFNVALAYARDRLRVRENYLLHEKIAELLAQNELPDDAAPHYEKAIALAEKPETALRIGVRYLLMLRVTDKREKAAAVEAGLRERWGGSPFLMLLQHAHPRAAAPVNAGPPDA